MFYAGLDLGKRHSYLAVVDERGRTVRQGRVESSPEGLLWALSGLGGGLKLALEATRAWEWAYDLLSDQGLEVTLVHPVVSRAIASARPGKRPAGRPHPGPEMRADLVARAYVAGKETRALRELLRYRAFLVGLGRAVKDRIHALLDRLLVRPPMATPFARKGLGWLAGLQLPEPYGEELAGLLRLLSALRQELELVAGRVREVARRDERALLLTTVPGLGRCPALLVLAEIGDVSRFPSARHLASYAGLVPSTYASAGAVRHGAITKGGLPLPQVGPSGGGHGRRAAAWAPA